MQKKGLYSTCVVPCIQAQKWLTKSHSQSGGEPAGDIVNDTNGTATSDNNDKKGSTGLSARPSVLAAVVCACMVIVILN